MNKRQIEYDTLVQKYNRDVIIGELEKRIDLLKKLKAEIYVQSQDDKQTNKRRETLLEFRLQINELDVKLKQNMELVNYLKNQYGIVNYDKYKRRSKSLGRMKKQLKETTDSLCQRLSRKRIQVTDNNTVHSGLTDKPQTVSVEFLDYAEPLISRSMEISRDCTVIDLDAAKHDTSLEYFNQKDFAELTVNTAKRLSRIDEEPLEETVASIEQEIQQTENALSSIKKNKNKNRDGCCMCFL